jgi:colanic acid/amylovoran biosynthesis glycosyltransferase
MNRRILIFTDNYPFGKSEPFLAPELKFINRSFDKVSVLPFDTGKDKKVRDIPEKTEILTPVFNEVKKKSELLIKGLFNTSILLILLDEGLRSKVWKSMARFRIWATHFLMIRSLLSEIKHRDLINFFNQFDVLYFYWGLCWSQVLPFLPTSVKAKIVVRFHGSDLYEYTNDGYIPWRHEQLSRIDRAIAISETGKKYIENQYPFMKDKILISRIGTEDYGINPYMKSDTLHLVSCSNLVPVKRVGLIANALAKLKIPSTWVHFGDGPDMKMIKKSVEQLPSHIKAELKGFVRHDDLINYFRTTSTDLFLNVSRSEGVPVSVMEAMSFGIPVIATDVGGTSEIVSDRNGLLIDADFYPEELAGKIETIAQKTDFNDLRLASRREWKKKSMAEKVYPEFINQLLLIIT